MAGELNVAKAAATWELYYQLPIMVQSGVITQAQADALKVTLKAELLDKLGLT